MVRRTVRTGPERNGSSTMPVYISNIQRFIRSWRSAMIKSFTHRKEPPSNQCLSLPSAGSVRLRKNQYSSTLDKTPYMSTLISYSLILSTILPLSRSQFPGISKRMIRSQLRLSLRKRKNQRGRKARKRRKKSLSQSQLDPLCMRKLISLTTCSHSISVPMTQRRRQSTIHSPLTWTL